MNGVYLLLGSNIGDRLDNLRMTENHLRTDGIKILNESSIYETEPWGKSDQNWFLNVVLHIETFLQPAELLELCLAVEKKMGRKRLEKWGERLIDIDILYYHDIELSTKELVIPHLAIADRRFTLIPLCELCPDEIHPTMKLTQNKLLEKCEDVLDCRRIELKM